MPRPEDCKYTREHEWIHVEGDVARLGISDFAQGELGDIVYVNMGDVPRSVTRGSELGEVESVKAVAQVYAPIDGTITSANPQLADHPELVNSDPFGEGWLATIRPASLAQLGELMDHAAYQAYLAETAH